MVENQHGLGSVLSFSAKSVKPKILEALLIGRKTLVNQLENKVNNIANDGLNHQVLIIGARGTGKTHMLSVLHNRIQPLITDQKIKVAYFAEEEYGIADFLDFLVRVLNAFIRWNSEDAEFLKSQLTVLQNTPSANQEDTIMRIIRDYVGKQPLLILAENFNDILGALKKTGQSKLRNWLQDHNRISIISTTQALSDDIGKEDKPFYGFFEEINIKPLSLEESFNLLKTLAKQEKREKVIEHLKANKAQIKAIHTLVKGNHRLLITFYEFLKSDRLSDLSVIFIKTLNDLKPYYETFIRYQTPQQQKIIRFLALAKTPQQGVDISKECFIDQRSLSKQLSELSKKKLVDVITDPNDKRNKLYDISEPLLRISIEIGEHKEGISALFIDFLALYYNHDELAQQKERFSRIYEACLDPKEKQQYGFEIEARERALELQEPFNGYGGIIDNFLILLKSKNLKEAEKLLLKIEKECKKDQYYYMSATLYKVKKEFLNAEKTIIKAIEIDVSNHLFWALLGTVKFLLEDFEKAIKAYKKSILLNKNKNELNSYLAMCYFKLEQYNEAIPYFEKALIQEPKNEVFLFNISFCYFRTKQREKTKLYLETLIKLSPEDYNYWIFLASIYFDLKLYDKTKDACKALLAINKNGTLAYGILGAIYLEEKNIKEALAIIVKIIEVGFKDKSSQKNLILNQVNFALNIILKNKSELTIEKCLNVENLIENEYGNPNELKINLLFIKTYRKVVLEGNEKALYDLTKEQREFFQKEILNAKPPNL